VNTYPFRDLLEAQSALEYFNHFHDAFVKKLCLASFDHFPERGVQTTSGIFEVEILFCHYNYRQGEPSPDQLVRATFQRVKDLQVSIRGVSYEWSVNRVEFSAIRRILEDNRAEPCLALALWQPRLNRRREWEHEEIVRFTFCTGEITEL
jgi:hypothetical protein